MTAETFREKVRDVHAYGNEYQIDQDKFKTVVVENNLKVIARATPEDKYLIAKGLKDLHRTVSATGEGMNDVKALKISEVGFCMGCGV